MEEIWKDIKGYESQYQVSNLGRVKSLDRILKYNNGAIYNKIGLILKQNKHKNGYYAVGLSSNNLIKTYKVHTLVAIAFLNHKPCGSKKVINHKDFNKSNNNVENLEIVSSRENSIHYTKTIRDFYTGVYPYRDKYVSYIHVENKNRFIGLFDTDIEASEQYNKCIKLLEQGKEIEVINNRNKTSKYKGVSWCKNNISWRAVCSVKGKYKNIGYFKNEYEAHLAYEDFKNKIIAI